MARIDDYRESFRLASTDLKTKDAAKLAKATGGVVSSDDRLIIKYFERNYVVQLRPEVSVTIEDSTEEVPIQDKILIVHYLLGSSDKKPTGKLITFRQIPDGHFYYEAFQKRARDPFLNFFGNNGRLFVKCAAMMGASHVDNGDFGMEFVIFPHIRTQLVLWNGDDEFPPDGTLLFDESIQWNLRVEDIAVMSGNLVYRLIALGRKFEPES